MGRPLLAPTTAALAALLAGLALAAPIERAHAQPALMPSPGAVPATPPPAPGSPPIGDPDAFDPILDGRAAPESDDKRLEVKDPRAPGVFVGAHAGAYMGAVQSYLDSDLSTLRTGAYLNFGFGLGYRTASLIELGVDVDLGIGQTYEDDVDETVIAFDLLVEPRVLAHFSETDDFSAYGGLAALGMAFDMEFEGINQAGLGPSAIIGVQWRSDRHSLLYLEASACAFYDLLAYRYREPNAAELEDDPELTEVRVDGDWFGIVRLTLGYRLTAL